MAKTLEYEIIWKVRRLFRALAEKSDQVLKPLGLTAADRAVLEFLYPDRALTVPQMARRFQVSRQHIQVTANKLKDLGLLMTEENPDHARSNLIRLTEAGQMRFSAIKDLENDIVLEIFEGIQGGEKMIVDRVLESLLKKAKKW